MINPYSNVNWATAQQIATTTHNHVITNESGQEVDPTVTTAYFRSLYNGGIRCFAISNYYPSAPMYPLEDFKEYIGGTVPDDIIEIPNAEQHNLAFNGLKGNSIHMNSIGSTFSSGQERGLSPSGYNGRIEDLVNDIVSNMLYSDGGGITINHPTWTYKQNLFAYDIIMSILDIDSHIVGIEIFNTSTWDTEIWDRILLTGRKCWGFAVPDHYHKTHATWYGRNVLVVPSLTQRECLMAIKNGNMYAKYANTSLAFENISLTDNTLSVEVSESATIRFISDGVVIAEHSNSTEAEFDTSKTFNYVRVEAETANDKIFSQPIMYYERARKKRIPHKMYLSAI